MTNKLHCDRIKEDEKFVEEFLEEQGDKEPTVDARYIATKVHYKKELCDMEEKK
ncbi:hypothetical protein ACT9XH_00635 [Methanococcoides methylutens]|uniref:hypothetical protein n=1 Tax=Methanococcoides methylutens TaxID=2226 RepID=UPI004044E797